GQMWTPIIEKEMKPLQDKLPGIKVVSYDVIPTFAEFKQKVLDYQDKVDAIGFLGVFEFKDENGKNVLLEDVLKWLQANSRLPDFSFWEDRVAKGTLCAVTVSGYAQGYQAGLLARSILLDGKSPSSLAMTPTAEGIPIINLLTAKRLNINPSSDVLLTARVVQTIALE
ncbi:MAG: ABC transporter substrate binding protein, partial [Sedimentisphaerales bacterium]